MRIEPLSYGTLDEAVALVDRVFPEQAWFEKANRVMPISLAIHERSPKSWLYRQILSGVGIGISELEYFVAVRDETPRVIGTTGLYEQTDDRDVASWLGWMCAHPDLRKQGIGNKLVDFAVDLARQRGKKVLRLYTSTDPNEAAAQELYERKGFRVTRREPIKGSNHEYLYREKQLV